MLYVEIKRRAPKLAHVSVSAVSGNRPLLTRTEETEHKHHQTPLEVEGESETYEMHARYTPNYKPKYPPRTNYDKTKVDSKEKPTARIAR